VMNCLGPSAGTLGPGTYSLLLAWGALGQC
jgi:hypothetical protein